MPKMQDKKKLMKALEGMKATPVQWKMAAILLNVNGIDNAMDFVDKIKPKAPEQLSLLNG